MLAAIGPHTAAFRKDEAPMFSPCAWHPGHGPNKKEGDSYVVGVYFAVFDFDDLHESQMSQAFSALEQVGLAHAILSTWSHTGKRKHEGDPKRYVVQGVRTPAQPGTYYQLRVIVPFSRKVLASEWHRLWQVLVERLFGGVELVDKSCKDTGHRYYAPTYNPVAGAPPINVVRDGGAIGVDALLESLGPPLPEAAPIVVARGETGLTRANLALVGRTLRGSRSEAKREIGVAIMHLVAGEPFATDEQDTTPLSYKMIREIRDRHPSATADAVLQYFMPSIAQMHTKVTREKLLEQYEHKDPNTIRADLTTRIAEAFNGARGEPYVPEDIQEMAEDLRCSTTDLQKRWIIQKGASYYVLCDGRYHCYSESDVGNAVLRDLAPAATVGIDLYEMTQRGQRRKGIAELVEAYGTVAEAVEVDLAAQRAHYDAVTRVLIEAPCPIRVTAKYDPDVEQWLRLLAGPKEDVLLDWIASITKLDEPCAALYMEGMGGTGKSFLAYALARVFTVDGAPTPLKEAMADFNELMTSCPIILADETIPMNSRGQMMTAEIREFVQARVRSLRRKYKPAATIKGALRLILAANNRGLLSASNENLTEFDVAALGERFVHIVVQPEARAFIESQDTVRWMAEDRVARHAMWLVENWEVKRTGRFIVAGQSQELVAALSTQTGLRATVCQWICNFLLRPATFVNQYSKDKLVMVDQGRLLVTARAIHEAWTMYIQDKGTPPTPTMIARALGGLSKAVSVRDGIVVRRYRDFDLLALASWSDATGYIDEQGIRDALVTLERDMTRGGQAISVTNVN